LKWDFNYLRDKNNFDDTLEGSHQYKIKELDKYAVFNDHFQYLYAERLRPRDAYPASIDNVVKKKTLGVYGEHTVFYLETYGLSKTVVSPELQHPKAKSEQLLYQVDAWLQEISPNVSVSTELTKSKEEVELRFEYGINKYKPKNVGFGLSYVLPIIVALLTAEKGKFIIIENPESHIHPRGQAELGKLLAAAAQTEAQLIVETHSDHILNGIRVAVKEKPAIREKVAIFFHDRITDKHEQYSQITTIQIDPQGELSDYPTNFLDEWSNQLFKLV
jgi:predicted ATPase